MPRSKSTKTTAAHLRQAYRHTYRDLLKFLRIHSEVRELKTEYDQKLIRFQGPNLSPEEETLETARIFEMFYGAVMSQQNSNWGRYASIVFQFFPPRPDEYIERGPQDKDRHYRVLQKNREDSRRQPNASARKTGISKME